MLVNLFGVFIFWGGQIGLSQLILSIDSSVSTFVLVPVPMFILMGEVIFQSGIAFKMIEVLDEWMGHLPGRLGLLAVGAGAMFATLTGVAMGSVAMLGSTLAPEMERRGYQKSMSLGPILGSGALAIMIPPSALGVILASLGRFSVGKLLVAIITPGLMLAAFFATYIVIRCKLQPSIAPSYEVTPAPLLNRIVDFMRYVLPMGLVILIVIGFIFFGVATPTEAAAVGTLVCFLLAAVYGKLNWGVTKKAVGAAVSITIMILLILTASAAFSQILAFSGASAGITRLAVSFPVAPIVVLMMMQVVLLLMGMFIEQTSIVMITIPIFMPIVAIMGWDPVWFGAIMLLSLEIATISPPFGASLFVMKAVAPLGTTMEDIYRATIPFIMLNLVVMGLMMAFPIIVMWLPELMR